jgi:SEC-C motif-containing protein
MSTVQTACPCDSGLPLSACCGRWHEGPQHLQAPDAPTLMRSRYSAYALGQWAYILDTWHPSTRPATLEALPEGLKWLGLQVKRTAVTGPTNAEVEFVARSKLAGQAHRMHEVSRFVLEAGRWWYVDGQVR